MLKKLLDVKLVKLVNKIMFLRNKLVMKGEENGFKN